jgi:hypothetical protein
MGAASHSGSEWSDMFGGVITGILGGILGGGIGILVACLPSVQSAFTNNPVLYYSPAAISAVVAGFAIIHIWF